MCKWHGTEGKNNSETNNKVPTQTACVDRSAKQINTKPKMQDIQTKQKTYRLFICPFDECLWHYSLGKDQYPFPKTFI